jgi:hypothetical protein
MAGGILFILAPGHCQVLDHQVLPFEDPAKLVGISIGLSDSITNAAFDGEDFFLQIHVYGVGLGIYRGYEGKT